jgi:hypothetical protein
VCSSDLLGNQQRTDQHDTFYKYTHTVTPGFYDL